MLGRKSRPNSRLLSTWLTHTINEIGKTRKLCEFEGYFDCVAKVFVAPVKDAEEASRLVLFFGLRQSEVGCRGDAV